jgi:hypothetical protein
VQALWVRPVGSQWCVVEEVDLGCSFAGTDGWSLLCRGLMRATVEHMLL